MTTLPVGRLFGEIHFTPDALQPCEKAGCGEQTPFILTIRVSDDDEGNGGELDLVLCPAHVGGFLGATDRMTWQEVTDG